MVAQNQGRVTVWGQETWSWVRIITWKQGRDMNLLQRHR